MIHNHSYISVVLSIFLFAYTVAPIDAQAEVRLWLTSRLTTGNLVQHASGTAREGADAFCNAEQLVAQGGNKPDISNSMTRAFISTSSEDEVLGFPSNYQVPTDEVVFRNDGVTRISANFAALLNTENVVLENFVSLTTGQTVTYTGTLSNGALAPNFCQGWTVSDQSIVSVGEANLTDSRFLDSITPFCSNPLPLYCLTYTPASSDQETCAVIKAATGNNFLLCL